MVDLQIFASPLSLILAAAFLIAVVVFGLRADSSRIARFATNMWTAVVLMLSTLVLMAVEGTWGIPLHRSWPFVVIVLLLSFSLGLTAYKDIRKKSITAALSHTGLFLILFGGLFGAPDVLDSQMVVSKDEPTNIAYMANGEIVPLPFEVQLKDFTIDYYENGTSPKQYTSTLTVGGKELRTSVNHPSGYKGYRFYQSDYDRYEQQYSIIKVVRDPWLPLVFLGMAILALAAILEVRRAWHSKAVLPVVIVLAGIFASISVARISFGTLMPALRSLWFIPHVIIYMLAYSVLAISLLSGILSRYVKRIPSELSGKLLVTASSLLLIGMLCGAAWAKAAWGQYWTWDAKENWAAVTWMLTLVGTHIPRRKNDIAVIVAILVSFLAMQITWYGVNYLPSSQNSLHTYNK
ncbi:MAG: cytochrome c biogenesis protein ResB [Bacteroidales bacterium]|nr:cytochrome c biogenesis protein ResB [Bacteroidales bacterium]